MNKINIKNLVLFVFFGLSLIAFNSCKNEKEEIKSKKVSKSKGLDKSDASSKNGVTRIWKNSFEEVISNLTETEFKEIYESLNKYGDISLELKRRLLNPIDGMKGTIHRFDELDSNIERLLQVTGEDGQRLYPEKDSFYIFSQYARVKKSDIDENDENYNPELKNKLIRDLNTYHKKKYNKILRDRSFTTQQFLDTYYLNKWTTIQTILYRGDTIQEITSINLNFDVGAVCPPICPEGI